MNSEPDDDALTWAGDSDPTLNPQPRAADPVGAGRRGPVDAGVPDADAAVRPGPADAVADAELPDGWSVPGRTAAADAETESRPSSQAAASAALVGTGILAGIYLLYAIGWFIGVSRTSNPLTDPVGQFMFSLGAWTAVASPLIWFGATFQLTRDRPRTRVVFLLLGVVLLAPLPFIIGAGGAS